MEVKLELHNSNLSLLGQEGRGRYSCDASKVVRSMPELVRELGAYSTQGILVGLWVETRWHTPWCPQALQDSFKTWNMNRCPLLEMRSAGMPCKPHTSTLRILAFDFFVRMKATKWFAFEDLSTVVNTRVWAYDEDKTVSKSRAICDKEYGIPRNWYGLKQGVDAASFLKGPQVQDVRGSRLTDKTKGV